MGTGIRIFIKYEFSLMQPGFGHDTVPFEGNVSVWDLQYAAIEFVKDYRSYSALAGARTSQTVITPLCAPRACRRIATFMRSRS
jgi:hypothetical protein